MVPKMFRGILVVGILLLVGVSVTSAQAPIGVFLTEVFYDHSGGDDGFEWVELYNTSGSPIDLSSYCIGNGGTDYTYSLVPLNGTINAGAVFVVGGPNADAENGNPTYNQAFNFTPDFQNSGTTADGVALFNVSCTSVTSLTVPIDAVVYGTSNNNNLIDETGSANPPEVGDAPSGSSIMRQSRVAGSAWGIDNTPEPNVANNPTAITLRSVAASGAGVPVLALVLGVGVLTAVSGVVLRQRKQG